MDSDIFLAAAMMLYLDFNLPRCQANNLGMCFYVSRVKGRPMNSHHPLYVSLREIFAPDRRRFSDFYMGTKLNLFEQERRMWALLLASEIAKEQE